MCVYNRQINTIFWISLSLTRSTFIKLSQENCNVCATPRQEKINNGYVHTQKRAQTRTNFVFAFKIALCLVCIKIECVCICGKLLKLLFAVSFRLFSTVSLFFQIKEQLTLRTQAWVGMGAAKSDLSLCRLSLPKKVFYFFPPFLEVCVKPSQLPSVPVI